MSKKKFDNELSHSKEIAYDGKIIMSPIITKKKY